MTLPTSSLDLGGEHAQVSHGTLSKPSLSLTQEGTVPLTGRHAADASLWSAIVTMLATLEFNAAKDEDENDIVFEATFTSGLTV